jgi:hypothetical protein
LIEFLPYVLQALIPVSVGVVAAFKYRQKGEQGIAFMSAAFFISAIPALVNLALGGPYLYPRLAQQGYSSAEMGTVSLYLFATSIIFETASAIIFLIGLFRLTRKLK